MALQLSVISSEVIKPSSPTPQHLRHHKLSIIDQYVPPVPVSCVLYYPSLTATTVKGIAGTEAARVLKSSLSETLADFYPLAGRISDNKSIECNDEGVKFTETRVMGRKLDQVINDAVAQEIETLLPKDRFFRSGPKVLLSIQFNKFDCGGMALGVRIAHKASDVSSLNLFLQNWVANTRGDRDNVVHPKYEVSSFYPGNDSVSTIVFPARKPTQKLVSKRYVLSASNIAALKNRCAYHSVVQNPSRVEAVSALIWRSALKALRKTKVDVKPKSRADVYVNLRGRMTPPLSSQYAGNMSTPAMVISGTEETELGSLVDKIRTAVTEFDRELLKKAQDDKELQKNLAESFRQFEKFETYTFTSWCRFPFYETDFGWGRPAWLSTSGRIIANSVILLDAKDGEGVEAWVTLTEPVMANFEADPDITAFTSNATN